MHNLAGRPGIEMLDSIIKLRPASRNTAVAVSSSTFFSPWKLRLLQSEKGKVLFSGHRADWSLVQGHVTVELLDTISRHI